MRIETLRKSTKFMVIEFGREMPICFIKFVAHLNLNWRGCSGPFFIARVNRRREWTRFNQDANSIISRKRVRYVAYIVDLFRFASVFHMLEKCIILFFHSLLCLSTFSHPSTKLKKKTIKGKKNSEKTKTKRKEKKTTILWFGVFLTKLPGQFTKDIQRDCLTTYNQIYADFRDIPVNTIQSSLPLPAFDAPIRTISTALQDVKCLYTDMLKFQQLRYQPKQHINLHEPLYRAT